MFLYEFKRAHYSVFKVKYADVFDDAHDEAFDLIWDSCYQKALDSAF